jgi:DNA-directed RNA polymerase subunit beta'
MLMLAPNNFLSSATGDAILTPSQDMILGSYYLTANNPTQQSSKEHYFCSFDDVIAAYIQSVLNLHTFVWVRLSSEQYAAAKTNLFPNSNFIEKKFTTYVIHLYPEVQVKRDLDGNFLQAYLKITPGRIILNQAFEHKE